MAKLFQHGTLAMLVDGLFDGTIYAKDLLKQGDFGIGTAQGLNGELIILDGLAYQALSNGTVEKLADDELIPFADVHHAHFNGEMEFNDIAMDNVADQLARFVNYRNTFTAVKITGKFKQVKTRVVKKQSKPYPTLRQTAEEQVVFDGTDLVGTVVGYYSPDLYHGASVAGMHLHFIDENHQFGGHLLDFVTADANISWEVLDGLDLNLPIENQDFMNYKPSDLQSISDSIKKSE